MRAITRAASAAQRSDLGSRAALDDYAEPSDTRERCQLGDTEPDPWRTKFGAQHFGQRLGKSLEELVRVIGGERLYTLDYSRVVERIVEIVAGKRLRRR